MKNRSGASQRRETLRKEYWPKEDPWTGENEMGWFRSPRTLPLVLTLLSSKEISGEKDPSPVYLELMARHVGDGVIEMGHEADHAFASGYSGARAVRTWQERMKILERYGFIKTKKIGNQQYRLVLLVHPTVAVQQLRDKHLIPEEWWGAYRQRQLETKELTFEQREKKKKERAKVIPMKAPKSGKVASA